MAVPIISTIQSVLGYLQGEYFEFQPYATNAPTSWAMGSASLPFGITLDTTSGLISGAALFPGVYNFSLIATNGDGASAEQLFTMGIEASAQDPGTSIEISIDLTTRSVTVPALIIKRGDDVNFLITFLKGGLAVDLNLASLKFGLKQTDTGAIMDLATQLWVKTGALTQARYILYVQFACQDLTTLLQALKDAVNNFTGDAEIEWVETVSAPLDGWPATLRGTTQSFPLEVMNDEVPDA